MMALKYNRDLIMHLEERGDTSSEAYHAAVLLVANMEPQVGDWTESIDLSRSDDQGLTLPQDVADAAKDGDIARVLKWLGPPPVDKLKLDAKDPDFLDTTLLFGALLSNSPDLARILLQLGAAVDAVNAEGMTPLSFSVWGPKRN